MHAIAELVPSAYHAPVSHRPYKHALFAQFARIGTALSSDRRLELLDLLAQGPRHVEALAAEAGMPVANASQHLQVLRQARLVEADREGTRVRYRLAGDSVLRLWLALQDVAGDRIAEVGDLTRRYAAGRALSEQLPRDELAELVRRGEVVVVDVRPPLEYAAGHLPGALSIPVDQLDERLADLPKDRRIVAYCRGEYCLFADEAVARLRKLGYDAVRLDGGWLEWRAEHGAEHAATS